jgi:hypothetical protein
MGDTTPAESIRISDSIEFIPDINYTFYKPVKDDFFV